MSPSFSTSRLPTSNGITKVNTTTATNGNNTKNDMIFSRLHISGTAKATDELQRRKCENLISFFTTQIHRLNKELETEKRSRDTHLAKIAKALLCFEAKLKNDQKLIRQQLYEKDTQLNRLANEVISLRRKYGVKDGEQYKIDSVAQYCPNCRKEYYYSSTTDIGIQVNKHGLSCRDDIDKGKKYRFSIILHVICIHACISTYDTCLYREIMSTKGLIILTKSMNFTCTTV